MKIVSVDAAGLDTDKYHRFGNYVFSENLIRALKKFDKNNRYYFYRFERHFPRLAWMKAQVSLKEFINKKDVFLAFNQALPLYVSGKVISFCHGLSYYFFQNKYSKASLRRLKFQLKEMVCRSDYLVVSSIKVKKELAEIYPQIKERIKVLLFGIPFDISNNKKNLVKKSINEYYLFVGMDHPIKNIDFLRSIKGVNIKMVTSGCPRPRLIKLYLGAKALLTVSDYESFNLPVLEALSLGCPVIGLKSAIIPELEPFVHVAKSKNGFIKLLNSTIKRPDQKTINVLRKIFNWEDYVRKLVKLY